MRQPVYFGIIFIIIFFLSPSPELLGQIRNTKADSAINSFNDNFLFLSNGNTFYKRALNDNQHDGTWTLALDIFGMQDAYERNPTEQNRKLVKDLCESFLVFNPPPYSWDGWNDDLAWMGLALARGYQITGSSKLLPAAESTFRLAFDRGWNTIFNDGGIWEQQPDMTPADGTVNKEALSNNPNGKLACLLFESTGNEYYKDRALQIYQWSRSHIFNPNTGQVYAGIDRAEWVNKGSAVYNQGSFIDFAAHLYRITGDEMLLRDAELAADYVIRNMTTNGVISNTAAYLNTWADEYARGLGHLCTWNPLLWNKYYAFMKSNGEAAWRNRRKDLHLSWNGWAVPTPINAAAIPTHFVSTVAMLQYVPMVQSLPAIIEAEDYNFSKGVIATTENPKTIAGIDQGDWIEYIVNVSHAGTYTMSFKVSSTSPASFDLMEDNVKVAFINFQSTGNSQTFTTVKKAVYLNGGIHSIKLRATTGGWRIDQWQADLCNHIVPFVSVNGLEQQRADVQANTDDDILLSPQPLDGGWSWVGPGGYTSAARTVMLSSLTHQQGGIYVAQHTDASGCISEQKFTVGVNNCSPTALTFDVLVNAVSTQHANVVTVRAGSYLKIVPSEETREFLWNGPGGFTSRERVIQSVSVGYDDVGTYILQYKNLNGCVSTQEVEVVVTGTDPCSSPITPYINASGTGWKLQSYASLNNGDNIQFGPQPLDAGSWHWIGPNGFTSDSREFAIQNFDASKAGVYEASFTNVAGCTSTLAFILGMKQSCSQTALVPEILVDGERWNDTDSITVLSGADISISFAEQIGDWNWSGPHNFRANSRSVVFEDVLFWKKGNYEISVVNDQACVLTTSLYIDVAGDDFCATPIVPYFNVNDSGWQNESEIALNPGDKLQVGPHPIKNMWIWNGPDNFFGNTREFTIESIQEHQSGVYHAMYTNNLGCLSFKDFLFAVNPDVPLGTEPRVDSLYFFPNPTTGKIVIDETLGNSEVFITDSQGRTLMRTRPSQENTIDIGHLPSGLYLIFSGALRVHRLIKQ